MIKAIIFDMDDVIVNSSVLHFKAYKQALTREFKMDVDVTELTRQ